MSPKWKDNQPLTALTGRCLSEKVSLPLLHHRLFRMAELYPRPFHFVKKKFFGHNPRRQPRPFFNPRRSRHRNPQRHRRCRPLSEANTTCRHRAAITLGTKSRQPSHRRPPSPPFEPLCREWYNTCILSCKVIILCMVNIMQNPYRRREVYFLEKVLTAHSRKIRKRSVEFVCLLKQGKSVLSEQAM